MKHFSTLLCIFALGFAVEMGTSCTKQTLPPVTNTTVVKDFKVIQQDTTGSQPSNGHHCGNGGSGQG